MNGRVGESVRRDAKPSSQEDEMTHATADVGVRSEPGKHREEVVEDGLQVRSEERGEGVPVGHRVARCCETGQSCQLG